MVKNKNTTKKKQQKNFKILNKNNYIKKNLIKTHFVVFVEILATIF